MITLGVLVSGGGTNLQAILDAIAAGTLDARIGVVVSNVAGAGALDRARRAGVPGAVVEVLREHRAELVVLAGFMRIVTDVLLDAFPTRVVNIHPALLPAFPG